MGSISPAQEKKGRLRRVQAELERGKKTARETRRLPLNSVRPRPPRVLVARNLLPPPTSVPTPNATVPHCDYPHRKPASHRTAPSSPSTLNHLVLPPQARILCDESSWPAATTAAAGRCSGLPRPSRRRPGLSPLLRPPPPALVSHLRRTRAGATVLLQ